jgi:deazaflavin-dependent oxidoreductase (nitroreductase family)
VSLADRVRRRLFQVGVRLNRFLYELSGGAIGGSLGGAPVLLLTTIGRKSGKERTKPLLYLAGETGLVVVASYGGAPTHPAWFLNLEATPDVWVQIKRERRPMRARRATPEEREQLWPRVVDLYPSYESYQRRTTREIPVVVLEPPAGRSLRPTGADRAE